MTKATGPMHGNVTTAAWIFGGALVLASLVLVLGIYFVVLIATDRADATARQHAAAVEQAGESVAVPLSDLAAAFNEGVIAAIESHGDAVKSAGTTVGEAFDAPLQVSVNTPRDTPLSVQLGRPVELQQPLVIEGTVGEDRSLPVNIFE